MSFLKEKLISYNPDLWENFEQCTSGFGTVDKEYSDSRMYISKVRDLKLGNIESYMVYIVFAELKGFTCEWKKAEKTLFTILFNFENHYCFFSMEKSGLKFGIDEEDPLLIKKLFGKLHSSIRITNKLLQPVYEETINNGDFTIENRSILLQERYLYYRNKADEINKSLPDFTNGDVFTNYSNRIKSEKEMIFNTQAMLDSYFSFQEHILALLIPFSKSTIERRKFSELISDQWNAKFTQIFDVHQDSEMMRNYTRLKKIKEIRNKYAHGGFKKKNGSLLTHIEGVGAIPTELSDQKDNDIYSFVMIDDVNYEEICDIIDEFEKYLRVSIWLRPIQIIESGLDINCDEASIDEYTRAIDSEENLNYFLDKSFYLIDREMNMEW